MNKIPYSVRSVIDNPTLRGIHDILGNLVNTKSEYVTMLDVALGASSNNIVVNDEACAKEAIDYLKRQNKGRATFFPLNVIKPKSIEPEILRNISNIIGFIGIASDLVTYDNKYYNIVMNQLGNIIVTDNITSAIAISKKINHRYRVISLDGELIHVGGVMTGGSIKTNSSYISDKYELEKLKNSLNVINNDIVEAEKKVNELDSDLNIIKDNIYNLNIEIIKNKESLNNKNSILETLNSELESVVNEIDNLSDNNLSKELDNVIKEYYNHEEKKNELEKTLNALNKEKIDLNNTLTTLETAIKKQNSEYNNLANEINNLELEITKININLDGLLNRLSEEYSLGYERARKEYVLEIDTEVARERVNMLRRKVKSLGDVNLGSIDEYDRISKRVNFLTKQKEDLNKAEATLLEIINDMDSIMEEKFNKTFQEIKQEFQKVFRELFKGGSANLYMTDPNNILETGIELEATPPGKNLKTVQSLSGGEKTFTAIALLFAILNVRPVPFCLFDEVEAALDEANVDAFGEYLNKYRNKTQFIIITHKKKTMEFIDTLYGITMQESGVSKKVSVKLNDLTKDNK